MKNEATAARREAKKAAKSAHIERMAKIHAGAMLIVKVGKCPECGAAISRNNSLAGWWQCDRSGSASFRRDITGASCGFQTFTE